MFLFVIFVFRCVGWLCLIWGCLICFVLIVDWVVRLGCEWEVDFYCAIDYFDLD